MGDISLYFNRREFACRCGCGFDTVDAELLDVLCEAREYFRAPVIIHSGCRCEAHNKAVNGAPRSQHLIGRAADIRIPLVWPAELYDYLANRHPGRLGLILYPEFVHVDSRFPSTRSRFTINNIPVGPDHG